MKEKKTAVITFRTEEWTKEALERIASANKWSVAQTVNELCKKYAINPRPEEIIIKANDLINLANDVKTEGENKAVKLSINIEFDGEKAYKAIRTEVWECGGYGCIGDFDEIREMTAKEIRDIP